jgi:hypothetical protein
MCRGHSAPAVRWRCRTVQGAAGERVDKSAGHRWCEQSHPLGHGTDRSKQLPFGCVSEKESTGSGSQRLVDVLVQVKRRHNQDGGWGIEGREAPGRGDPVQSWHPDIHEDDVGLQPAGPARSPPHRRLPHLPRRYRARLQDHPKAGPDQSLVIGKQHTDAHGDATRAGNLAPDRVATVRFRAAAQAAAVQFSPLPHRLPDRDRGAPSDVPGPSSTTSTAIATGS